MTTKIHLLIWDPVIRYHPLNSSEHPHGDGKMPFVYDASDGDGTGQGGSDLGDRLRHGDGHEFGFGDRRGNGRSV